MARVAWGKGWCGLVRGIGLIVMLTVCSACSPASSEVLVTPVPTLARLPTVTPEQATPTPPSYAALPTHAALPTAAPSLAPTPGAAEVQMTEDGAVTPSMARLALSAERYATLGDPRAPITIVEFSDFGCPFCRRFAVTTFPVLKAQYIDTGRVYYVYKDLPVVSTRGDLAAQAAACAGEQGAYWDMHHELFASEEWNGTEEEALAAFQRYAANLKLDAVALGACVSTGRYAANVQRNFEEAQALRIFGTPSFFINGKLLSGAQPLELWTEVLTAELGGG